MMMNQAKTDTKCSDHLSNASYMLLLYRFLYLCPDNLIKNSTKAVPTYADTTRLQAWLLELVYLLLYMKGSKHPGHRRLKVN